MKTWEWRSYTCASMILWLVACWWPMQAQGAVALVVEPGLESRLVIVDVATRQRLGSDLVLQVGASYVAVSSDGQRAFVANTRSEALSNHGSLAIITLKPAQVTQTVQLTMQPSAVVSSPDGRLVYVAGASPSSVAWIDASLNVVGTIYSTSMPLGGLAISPDGSQLYVAEGSSILVLGTGDGAAAGTIPADVLAVGHMSMGPDGTTLYAVARDKNDASQGLLVVVSTVSRSVRAILPVGKSSNGLAVSPNGGVIAVANTGDGTVSLVSATDLSDATTIPVGAAPEGASFTPDGRYLWVSNNGSSTISIVDVSARSVVATLAGFPGAGSVGTFISADSAPVVEFYNKSLDHYFETQELSEILDLDRGVHLGWNRTGQYFIANLPDTKAAETAAVCRFYGVPASGLDSHFYSADQSECLAVKVQFPGVWIEETPDAFELILPNSQSGACPSKTTPVYRLWNGRTDSNHRYTSDLAIRAQMLAKGSIAEGYGPLGVVMCALQ